jgi:L-threonylcarbamoyladenylate synthase
MILGPLEIKKQSKFVNSPGQLASHYAPDTPMRLDVKTRNKGELLLGFGPNEADLWLSKKGNLTEAAVNLFSHMRSMDILAKKVGARCIAVAPIPYTGLGMAINDRLKRAASND